jgi:Holliday junction resolvasome RuvABC endonuclease subunit
MPDISIAQPAQDITLRLTGYGAARKEQVGYMVRQWLHLPAVPKPDDAADAAAIAICHAHMFRLSTMNAVK